MRKAIIRLSKKEIKFLKMYKKKLQHSEREYNRSNILLLLHKGKKDADIEDFLDVDRTTIWRTKQKFLKDGIEKALEEKYRSGQPVKYGTKQTAEIIATAFSDPPKGRSRWTLELLTNTLREQKSMSTLNKESVRLILKKTNVSLG